MPMFWVFWGIIGFYVLDDQLAEIQIPPVNRLFYVVLYILAIFVSVLSHELGHAFFYRKYGRRYVDIVIDGLFGVARSEAQLVNRNQRFVMIAAGPFMNLVLALTAKALIYVLFKAGVAPGAPIYWFLFLMKEWNYLLMVLNLIPVFPLDGGQIVDCFVRSKKTTFLVGVIASAIGCIWCVSNGYIIFGGFLGIYGYKNYQNYSRY